MQLKHKLVPAIVSSFLLFQGSPIAANAIENMPPSILEAIQNIDNNDDSKNKKIKNIINYNSNKNSYKNKPNLQKDLNTVETIDNNIVVEKALINIEDKKEDDENNISTLNDVLKENSTSVIEENQIDKYFYRYEANPAITRYGNINTQKFIASIGEQAREIAQENDLYASVMIAQAVLESDSGTSSLSKTPYNNLFGIKGVWYDSAGIGHKATFKTLEDDGEGNLYEIDANFRAYNTMMDSLQNYADLLTKEMGDFYFGARKSVAADCYQAAKYLQGRYATDTAYASKLTYIINTYNLTRYDNPLNYKVSGDMFIPEIQDGIIDTSLGEKLDGIRDFTMKDYAFLQGKATSFLSSNYVENGKSDQDGGYDAYGLIVRSYKDSLNIDLPSDEQEAQFLGTEIKIDENELRMGDLLFWSDEIGNVTHISMYLGDGCYIHSSKNDGYVKISALDESTPVFAKRILNFENIE